MVRRPDHSAAVTFLMVAGICALGFGAGTPATHPATRKVMPFWLGLSLREASTIEDPILQTQAYSKAAVLLAVRGDVEGYHQTIGLAEKALGRAASPPAKSPVTQAAEGAAMPLLRAMARNGDVAGAKALTEKRSKANVYFRPGYYEAIAGGQVEAGDLEGALATARTLSEYDRQGPLGAIVRALSVRKEFTQAQRIAAMMTGGSTHRGDALRAIARGLAKAGQYEAALAMADQLRFASDKQDVYQDVANVQAERGNYAAACATAARVPLGERNPHYGRSVAYTAIARLQLKRKNIAGAKATAALVEGSLKPYLLREISIAEIGAGDLASARRTADSIPPVSDGLGGDSPSSEAHAALAVALARSGEIASAISVAHALPLPSQTLLDIAEIAAARGDKDAARQLVRELKDNAFPAGRWFAMHAGSTNIRIARVEKTLGDPGPYQALIAGLKRRAAQPGNSAADRMARLQLFGLYLGEGEIGPARQLASSIPPDILNLMVAGAAIDAARRGHLARAQTMVDLMPTAADRAAFRQQVLANSPKPAVTPAEIAYQIRRLPTAYDRSLAYLSHAQASWRQSQGNLRQGE